MGAKSLRLLLLTLLSVLILQVATVKASGVKSREYAIKAAFLYNFAKFVEWPQHSFPNSTSPMHMCILGDDPFEGALDSLEGKTVKGRVLGTKYLKRLPKASECQIVFICASETDNVKNILAELKGRSVLTVGDMQGFAELGGMINLITTGNKIRFEINVDAAIQAGLKISSKLLKLGKIVESASQQEKR